MPLNETTEDKNKFDLEIYTRKCAQLNSGEHIEPQPLFKDAPPAAPFPMDALGSIGASAALAIQRVVKAPDVTGPAKAISRTLLT